MLKKAAPVLSFIKDAAALLVILGFSLGATAGIVRTVGKGLALWAQAHPLRMLSIVAAMAATLVWLSWKHWKQSRRCSYLERKISGMFDPPPVDPKRDYLPYDRSGKKTY